MVKQGGLVSVCVTTLFTYGCLDNGLDEPPDDYHIVLCLVLEEFFQSPEDPEATTDRNRSLGVSKGAGEPIACSG